MPGKSVTARSACTACAKLRHQKTRQYLHGMLLAASAPEASQQALHDVASHNGCALASIAVTRTLSLMQSMTGDVTNESMVCRVMSLSDAISSWGMHEKAEENLRAWLTHKDRAFSMDAAIDVGLHKLTETHLQQAGLTELSQRLLVLERLSQAGRPSAFRSPSSNG